MQTGHDVRRNVRAGAAPLSRRDVVRLGGLGLALPHWLALRGLAEEPQAGGSPIGSVTAGSATVRFGGARSCIVLFAWGGMSHIDTLDMKPAAGADIRGTFRPIGTSTPGLQLCEHLPRLARQTHRMAIVRSVHHEAPSHRSAAYWNLTGHPPPNLGGNWQATRHDWPTLGSLVWEARARRPADSVADSVADGAAARAAPAALPGAAALPYPIYDGGRANGQDAGFLGLARDPVVVRPAAGQPYDGKSPTSGYLELGALEGVDRSRLVSRRGLLEALDARGGGPHADTTAGATQARRQALDMLLDPRVRQAFDLEREPAATRDKYGMHICGQSALLARKLSEAGVPLVTVYCAAGDLNGSVGAHWDTHGNGFQRLSTQMLPPWDQASSALLDDLAARGRLDETLIVWLTEFGRTPKVDAGGGRNHYPNVYSVAFAGGGIAGGQIYGSSDPSGSEPRDNPCGPADLHATVFHALGIDGRLTVRDLNDRPLPLCTGHPLPLFG